MDNGILGAMEAAVDVIAAVASGAGSAAIGVVRLSGPGSWGIALSLCRDRTVPPPERHLALSWLAEPRTGRLLDQAMTAFFAAGASYTGEESVELYCHGGPALLDRVLRACLDGGARPARPGEFTRRAVAAGRLDLVQAEAVALLASAETDPALDAGLSALSGRPSAEVSAAREALLDVLADVEAALDHAEEDGVVVALDEVATRLVVQAERLRGWWEAARALRPAVSGVRVALIGAPNAGKSSLFNALLGRDRAIVHAEAGTTRDVVGEMLPLAGAPCLVLDTAGLRDAGAGEVEAEGVLRAREAARDADVVIHVVDGSGTAPSDGFTERVDIVAMTKADLWPGKDPPRVDAPSGVPVVFTSARDGRGIERLRALLADRAAAAVRSGDTARAVVVGERQAQALHSALRCVEAAVEGQAGDAPLEAVAAELRRAVEHLGEIDGSRITDEVLDRIFSRFCLGK
jgi:tRNA modification GTPase